MPVDLLERQVSLAHNMAKADDTGLPVDTNNQIGSQVTHQ